MSGWAVFLWPLLVFLAIGALGALWQARHPESEIAARERLIAIHRDSPRWRGMPSWQAYRAVQDDPVRYARSAYRRTIVLGLAAAAVALSLALGY